MNGGDNSWIGWVIAAAVLAYWLSISNATGAANASQTGVPAGSKVAGSTVYNSAGQVIGSITSAGYYYPSVLPTSTATSNPLTGTTVINYQGQLQVPAWTGQPSGTPVTCPTGKKLVDVGDIVALYTCQ